MDHPASEETVNDQLSRREMIARSGACLGAAVAVSADTASTATAAPEEENPAEPFGYCLNTATLMGHKLTIEREVEIAAEAGYRGIEPWMRNLRRYVEEGGKLADLKKKIADAGLSVESAMGFPRWIVDDDAQRAEGMEEMKRDMDMLAQIGGLRVAAPPAGAHSATGMDLRVIGERYRAVLELGREIGVVPQLEIWGSAKTMGRLSEAVFVAAEAAHPDACLLLDAYHLYKSGGGFEGLRMVNGRAMHVFHINDYPDDPPRETISDSHRVFPGDGVCPYKQLLGIMHAAGFRGMLSLELFNRDYWKQDPLTVAKTGLEKTRAAVRRAMG